MSLLLAAAYSGFGALFYLAIRQSVELSNPKWITVPIVVALWPLALIIALWGFLRWIARGSH